MDSADIIYLEVDAEITEAIDKLKGAKTDAVKIVVPARSSLLQSAVNLKLLKKSAKDHGKELALVTTDKTARYLAGGIGLAVASSVKAMPEVPEAREEEIEPDIVGPEPVEAAAAAAVVAKAEKNKKAVDSSKSTSSSPDSDSGSKADDAVVRRRTLGEEEGSVASTAASKTDKSAKVPNYSAFQKKLGIGAIVFGAIMAFIAMMIFLPTGKVTLLAKANKLGVDSKFIVDSSTADNDASSLTYAGQKLELAKDLTANFTATGKKDVGTKAAGTVTISNASNSDPVAIPAGTVLTSAGKSFTLNAATTVPGAKLQGGQIVPGKVSAAITAAANGDSYNLGTTTFSVTGYNDKVTASGSTTGGTSKTVTVVTQGDIEKAKQQAIDGDATAGKDALFAKADKNSNVFEDTFATNADATSSSAPVDSENANGTVTVKAKYSVLTATNDTLNSLLDTLAKADLPDGDQQLYQNGLDDAKFSLVKAINDTKTQMQVTTSAYYGKKIDTSKVAKSVAGKSKKDVTTIAQQDNPSVTGSEVETTPSLLPWMPSLSNRIKVTIRVSTQ